MAAVSKGELGLIYFATELHARSDLRPLFHMATGAKYTGLGEVAKEGTRLGILGVFQIKELHTQAIHRFFYSKAMEGRGEGTCVDLGWDVA